MSFRLKTIVGIAVIELTVMAILITLNQLTLGGSASTQLYDRARTTAALFATMTADAVISVDLATLDSMIENTLSSDELVYLRVRDVTGSVLSADGSADALGRAFRADQSFDAALSDHLIDVSAAIEIGGQTYGFVEMGISTRLVEAEMAAALRSNLVIATIGMGLVALFGYILGSVLTRQLSLLRQGARMIATGNLDYQIDVRSKDELAETARCFNEMAVSLATDRKALDARQIELIEKRDRTSLIVQSMTKIASGKPSVSVPDQDRADEIGDMARATVVFRDAMTAVQTAKAEQARLIYAFDQLDEQVAIFGEDGVSIFLNSAFRAFNAHILADLPEAFTYEGFLQAGLKHGAFPGADGQAQEWLSRRLSATCNDAPVEVARAPDRTLLVRQMTVDGIGTVISAADISDLKTSQAQLLQASKLATLGEMATGIAHELNQPLGVIRMASSNCIKRISKGSLDADYLTGKLQRMADQTERAAQIINHMRIFGRTVDGEARDFDLADSLENACDLMAKQLALAGIALTKSLGETPSPVQGQPVMFEQVVLNLLSNARDAIEASDNRQDGEVSVCLEPAAPGRYSVVVEDTGGGVPDAIIERLFDPFFTTKEPGKGTGLGLSISYGIIKEMGGSLSVRNTERGARFEIELPEVMGGQGRDAA